MPAVFNSAARYGALAFALFCGGHAAAQQSYPAKPVRMIVPFAPGGGTDTLGRLVALKLGEIWNTSVVVENRPGAGSTVGTDLAARAAPDGYTLMLLTTANATNETLFRSMQYKVGPHFTAVAPLAETNNVLVVHPSLPATNMAEFIALAKAKPDELFYATAGIGSSTHLSHALFDMMAGTRMKPVHYRGGGPAMADLLSGQVKIMFSSIAPVIGAVREGRLRALATTGPTATA